MEEDDVTVFKYFDTASTLYQLNSVTSVALLNGIQQGSSDNERVGKEVLLKNLYIRGVAEITLTASRWRTCYAVVYDRKPTGALPAVSDIFNTTGVDPDAMQNMANSTRFVVLRRINSNFVPNTERIMESVREHINMVGFKTVWDTTAVGGITAIKHGAIYFVTFGQGLSSIDGQLTATTRITYEENDSKNYY